LDREIAAVPSQQLRDGGWEVAAPGYEWRFPRDHWGHPEFKTEWWYFVGHLESVTGGKRFGYQFTFFRVGVLPERPELDSAWAASDLVMVHAAISDLEGEEHRFREVVYRASPLLSGFSEYPKAVIAWSQGPAGSPERWTLRWNGEGFDLAMTDDARGMALRLRAHSRRAPVLQGPGGYSRKAEGADHASLYYSFTRMETAGTVVLDGREHPVRGVSWLDREMGSNQLADHQMGWDWFGLQLDDGRDLMLFRLRGIVYWEGPVSVRGTEGRPLGRGYVELTGYGTDNRPAL
jgi:predicted secreted hydrolase